jgi:Tol biopolymer transport system component
MSPEQLRGADADARSDVWAFGCVLYQMLTGRAPFDSPSEAAVGAAILDTDPLPLSTAARGVSPSLQRVVDRCLAKNPDDRWQSVADLRHELEWIAREASRTDIGPGTSGIVTRTSRLPWAVAVFAVLIALAAIAAMMFRSRADSAPSADVFTVPVAELDGPALFPALSQDGRQITYYGRSRQGGEPVLWVGAMDSAAAPRPLARTTASPRPHEFWSADGRSIGFFAEGKLKTVDVASGTIRVIADAPIGRGGAWNRDGVIIFAPVSDGALQRVSAEGGAPAPVTRVRQGESHRFPSFLSDDAHFVFIALEPDGSSSIRIGSLNSQDSIELSHQPAGNANDVSQAWVVSGWLLFSRQGSLYARRLDQSRWQLTGDERVLAQEVDFDGNGRQAFSVGDDLLVYRSARRPLERISWLSRDGKAGTAMWQPSELASIVLSPDGSHAAVITVERSAPSPVWVLDAQRGDASRISSQSANSPIWSRDSTRVLFTRVNGLFGAEIHSVRADGGGSDEIVVGGPGQKRAMGWSSAGNLLFALNDTGGGYGLWEASPDDSQRPILRAAKVPDRDFVTASMSQDGRLVAYVARDGLFIERVSGVGRVFVAAGAAVPAWRADGRELFYLANGGMMAVDVSVGDSVTVSQPRRLFDFAGTVFSPSADGQRFLAGVPGREAPPTPPLIFVVNWRSLLPAGR